jgi:hypothetical protein
VPELTLVIPAYNEAGRFHAGMERLQGAISAGAVDPETTEFLVVDDGSTDDTSACARAAFAPFPHTRIIRLPQNRGKGAAVRAGVAAGSADLVVFADADMAIDPVQLPLFLRALSTHDLAIGSRAASGASVDRPSLRRSLMNRTFNGFVNAVTHVGLDDTQCGFKAFRGPTARLLFHCCRTDGWAFDVEILSLARRLGFSIAQVPVHWSRVRDSRVRSWADTPPMARDVLRARKAHDDLPIAACRVTMRPDYSGADMDFLLALRTVCPVVHLDGTNFLALFPLHDEAGAAERATAIATRLGSAQAQPDSITLGQLVDRAPLALDWDGSAIQAAQA